MSRCPECEKQARRERAAAKASGEIEGQPDRNGRVMHFSDAERQRRSELAKRLHAEGRLGGPVNGRLGGQGVRKNRITDAVLEHFRQPEKQQLVIRAYESNLKAKNKPDRLKAAELIARMEEKADDRLRADRGGAVDPAAMTDDELLEFVAQGIQTAISRGEIPVDIELGDDSVQEIP
jgi:hypothetical protein